MLNIYKNQDDIPKDYKLVKINNIYFNKHTVHLLDEKAGEIIRKIDGAKWKGKYQIYSAFNQEVINIDKLSSGCKTVLNIMYNPKCVFSLKECGDNQYLIIGRNPSNLMLTKENLFELIRKEESGIISFFIKNIFD